MANISQARQRRTRGFSLAAIPTLAAWRLRRTWSLLLVIALGIIAAVVVAAAIPLFSDTLTTAGLRSTLRATPESAEIRVDTSTYTLSSAVARADHNQFDSLFRQQLGSFIQPEQSFLLSPDFSPGSPAVPNTTLLTYATSMQNAAAHLGTIQGRLAHATGTATSDLEVMMTPDTAQHLGLRLGSTFTLSLKASISAALYSGAAPVPQDIHENVVAHLVGMFSVPSTQMMYWHGEDFKTTSLAVEGQPTLYQCTLLVANDALLKLYDQISSDYHTDAIFSKSGQGYILDWYYRLNTSHLSIQDLDSLITRLATIQSIFTIRYSDLSEAGNDTPPDFPYLFHAQLLGVPLSSPQTQSILERFRSRVTTARIPIGVFALLAIALILFFVSLMTTLLVDRQTETIAVLRSRGASSGQVFGTFLLQSIALGFIALVIGLPLSVLVVIVLARRLLSPAALDAVNTVTSQPVHAGLGALPYALAVVVIVLLTMSVSLYGAARTDVLALRRESARTRRRPLWERLNLDVIAGILALAAYALSLYVTSIGNALQGDAKVLVATPLTIIAPFFLIIGCLFLFLRLFPWLLRLGARLASRRQGAVSLLALAQLARSPRQSLRMTLLLALASAFALFSLTYSATQASHVQDVLRYQTGADFSGQLASFTQSSRLDQVISRYQSIPGVIAASAGYVNHGLGGRADLPMERSGPSICPALSAP